MHRAEHRRALRREHRRFALTALGVLIVVGLAVSFTAYRHDATATDRLASKIADDVRSTPSSSPAADGPHASASPSMPARGHIELTSWSSTARPFQTVRIQGSYPGAAPRTVLRVQHLERGRWLAFPLPTATDATGRFTTYVDLGERGRHLLRMADEQRHVVSAPVTVLIR
jgi:hypothetical protein